MAKYLDSDGVAYLWSKIKARFAPIASPDLTGTPTAPTAATGTNTQQIATTAFVQNTVSSVASGVTGVKGNAESTYRTGNVNLTPANIGAAASSHTHGNITNGGDITATAPTIATNDCLVINDDSASKITNGPAFNTTHGGQYLRKDGTWQTPPDTKSTAGSSNNTTDKLYLIGSTTQQADLTTFSNSGLYATNGDLVAASLNGVIVSNKDANQNDIIEFKQRSNSNQFHVQGSSNPLGIELYASWTPGGEAALFIPDDTWYTLGAACEKSIGSVASGNTGLVTGGDVYTAINNAVVGSLNYQGSVTSQSGLGTTYKKGYYWIVGNVTAGTTIAGQVVETGDMILAHADYSGTIANDVDIVQSNVNRMTNTDIDNAITAGDAL